MLVGALAGAGAVAGLGALAGCSTPGTGYTVANWVAERGANFQVGHRGAGDVVPEHTIEAYEAALSWGARALEISVVQTSDGVLICQHDLTYDRTTNLKGRVASQPSSVLVNGRVTVPRLGPRWQGDGAPRIARLDDVLRRVGNRAVLIIEAKDDAAYPAIQRAIEDKSLHDSVMIKLHYASQRIASAHKAGYPVFCYIGVPEDVTDSNVKTVAAKLDPTKDALVIPAADGPNPLSDAQVKLAVDTGVPVWVFPVHRRWEVEHFNAAGVHAMVSSSIGYTSGSIPPVRSTDWPAGALQPGELTRYPESDAYALSWTEPGVVGLHVQGRQQFLELGELAPLDRPDGPWTLRFDMRIDALPKDLGSNVSIAFGHADDRYYEHQIGNADGYHAMIRMDGAMELRSHTVGSKAGDPLAPVAPSPALTPGAWIPLELQVEDKALTFRRTDTGASVTAQDSKYRGSYVHIGRSADNGKVSLRGLTIG